MQVTTTISFPKNMAQEMEKQIEQGKFTSRSEFIRSAVRTYLLFQKGDVSWEVLAAPFRSFAKQKKLNENDILCAVERGRRSEKNSKSSK
ncbi:ribbon-helix-helix domain-containing protein [Patescibacteria group bacterium]|nr:ribbon-helix-helix domain-containing protein [Patescibacteria group bacterium]MBU4016480.1 ribbon-helix-helix domain-containing protein [Patescibacteria group bacterium]MBU4099086.1 ribbon-helix-helix domain-containing protein [Patescibacteria group bacterium]